MFPVFVDLGGFELRTYGVAGATGFLLMAGLVLRDARRAGWSRDAVIDVILWASLAGIFGARLLFALQNPDPGLAGLFDLRGGGMVFYGALLGLPVGLGLVFRKGLPLWPLLDAFGRAMPLAHGVARLGCLGAGCCYGVPTNLPWGLVFDHPLSAAPRGIALHPVQLYEALGLFGITALLSWAMTRPHRPGSIFLSYLALYATLRILTERLRGDPDRDFWFPSLLGDSLSTSTGIALLVLAGVGLTAWWRRHRTAAPPDTAP